MSRTLAEVLADKVAVERKMKQCRVKADHYNAEVSGLERSHNRLEREEEEIRNTPKLEVGQIAKFKHVHSGAESIVMLKRKSVGKHFSWWFGHDVLLTPNEESMMLVEELTPINRTQVTFKVQT